MDRENSAAFCSSPSPVGSPLNSKPLSCESDKAVPDLNDVYESVEVVRGQDKAVSGAVVSPAAQQKIPTQ